MAIIFNSIVIKDPHFKFGFRVPYRYDFKGDVLHKLKQIQNYAENNNVDYLVIPGDIFDESYEDKWTFSHYFENVKYLEPFLNTFKEVLTIPGNHDYFNGFESPIKVNESGEIEKTTIYGEFVRQNMMKDLSYPKHEIINDVLITGIPYSSDLDKVRETLKKIDSELAKNNFKASIVMLHQNVTPRGVKNITEFTYSELSKYQNISVFCLGHYHIGYDTTKVNDSIFINPWNLTRVSRNYEVKIDKHIPTFTHLVIHDDGTVEYKDIQLDIKSFDEAFKPEYKSVLEIINKSQDVDLDLKIDSIDNDDLTDQNIIELILNQEIKDQNLKLKVMNTIKDYMEHFWKGI